MSAIESWYMCFKAEAERADCAEVRIADLESAIANERARAEAAEQRVGALLYQIEHAGCSAAHLGERTYECRIEAPCGLCRLRARAERAEAEFSRLGAQAFATLLRAEAAEARVRELEDALAKERAYREDVERETLKTFNRALGYRRALLEANRRRRIAQSDTTVVLINGAAMLRRLRRLWR